MLRKFKRIMKDASVRDWLNLANISNLKRSVYVSDIRSRSVKTTGLEIEWPIVWLLNACHRKHIFVPQRILETNYINTGAIKFTRRVEWAWALRKDSTLPPSFHVKTRDVASGTKRIPPTGKCWTTGIRNAILTATTR